MFFVLHPKGLLLKLPKDATPIDFAYAVHTKIGDSAIGCKINKKETTLQTDLKNGDIVNIIDFLKMLHHLYIGYLHLKLEKLELLLDDTGKTSLY